MGSREVYIWALRDYPIRIDRRVASIVMLLDMFHIYSAAHTWDLENVFRVIEQIHVLAKKFLVALEMNCINLKFIADSGI